MSVYEQIAASTDAASFKAAAQAVRHTIHTGTYGEQHQVMLYVLAMRGHALIARGGWRNRKASHLIANQVMLTLHAEPGDLP